MLVGLFTRIRRVGLSAARRVSAMSPARRHAERSLAAPIATAKLPETGREVARYFVAEPGRLEAKPTDTPDTSVVIPVYNSESWLDDCLSSVLAQTGVSLEVICVDDGSTDASRRVLERYAAVDPRVRIVEQQNAGQSVARNAGLAAARGRYLAYLDSDDFWRENGLAELVAEADADQLDVLLFDAVAFRDGEIEGKTWSWYSTYYPRVRAYRGVRTGARMIADMRRWGDYRPHVGMYLARTEFARTEGAPFIPGIVHQDNPYTFALLLAADRTAHVRRSIYARRLRPGSTITALQVTASARGYFLSYLAMSRELGRREFDAATSRDLKGVVVSVFDSAGKKFAAMPASAQVELGELDAAEDAWAAFEALRGGEVVP